MTQYNYAVKEYRKEHMARVVGRDLPISTKQSLMIANAIRGKSLIRAKTILGNVIKKKEAVPFTRFNFDIGHKKKIGPGRYPMKACEKILQLLESVESNAQVKGLNTNNLFIAFIIPQKAGNQYKYGRRFGRKMKRTHLEIMLEERKPEEKKK